MSPPYASYPGSNPIQKALQYLLATSPHLKRAPGTTTFDLAQALVRAHEPHALFSGGELAPANPSGTAYDRLEAYLDASNAENGLGALLNAALTANPADAPKIRTMLEGIISKLPKDDGTVAVSAALASYSGATDVERAHAMFMAREPGFAALSNHEQWSRVYVFLLGGGRPAAPSAQSAPAPTLRLASHAPTAEPPHLQAIRACSGSNDVDKAINYLSANQAGFAKRSWHEKNFIAGRYLETGAVQ